MSWSWLFRCSMRMGKADGVQRAIRIISAQQGAGKLWDPGGTEDILLWCWEVFQRRAHLSGSDMGHNTPEFIHSAGFCPGEDREAAGWAVCMHPQAKVCGQGVLMAEAVSGLSPTGVRASSG